VELKTQMLLQNPRIENSFKRTKLLHVWIQSFLAGVPYIVCGFRDERGVVRQLQQYRTLDLPKIADRAWDPYQCLAFANSVLSMLWENTKSQHKYVMTFQSPFDYVELKEVS